MNIGQLNRRVTIERWDETAGVDAFRQPVAAWVPVTGAWASMRVPSGLETIRGGAETSVVKVSIRIRFRAGLTAAMRVVYQGKPYKITAVLEDRARREYVDLVCEANDAVV